MGIRHGEKTILRKISAWESTISKWLADESCVIPVICDAFSQDNFVWCVVGVLLSLLVPPQCSE